MPKLLINASNLHVGGGVQVAASAISEIFESGMTTGDLSITISDEVAQNLSLSVLAKARLSSLIQIGVRGFDPFNFKFRKLVDQHDKILTIFGPLYRWRTPGESIVGFAQPWIIYPRNEVYRMLPILERLKTRLKFYLQKQFYKRADMLIVELDHVKHALVRELGVQPKRIHVVRNCVSSVYLDKEKWLPLRMPDGGGVLRLGFLGRNYLHKNTAIFPDIVRCLSRDHRIEAKFYVTFNDEEWDACSLEFRAACINIGPISVSQCPNFYKNLDAVVFPSLLECFSATPLETMAMGRPLFASDRPFNRDVCQNHAYYFDPHSPEEAARQIADVFSNGGPNQVALEEARDHALSFSSPVERANQYLALLGVGTN